MLVKMVTGGGDGAPIKVYTSAASEGNTISGNKTFTFNDFTTIRSVAVNNKGALYSSAILNDDGTISSFSYNTGYYNIVDISGNQVTVFANGSYVAWFQVVDN
jgi:hypothetical protein